MLDNIVDYLTYAFAPIVLLWTGGYLPNGFVRRGARGAAAACLQLPVLPDRREDRRPLLPRLPQLLERGRVLRGGARPQPDRDRHHPGDLLDPGLRPGQVRLPVADQGVPVDEPDHHGDLARRRTPYCWPRCRTRTRSSSLSRWPTSCTTAGSVSTSRSGLLDARPSDSGPWSGRRPRCSRPVRHRRDPAGGRLAQGADGVRTRSAAAGRFRRRPAAAARVPRRAGAQPGRLRAALRRPPTAAALPGPGRDRRESGRHRAARDPPDARPAESRSSGRPWSASCVGLGLLAVSAGQAGDSARHHATDHRRHRRADRHRRPGRPGHPLPARPRATALLGLLAGLGYAGVAISARLLAGRSRSASCSAVRRRTRCR